MILKDKFHNAYVADSYTKQYENYQKIADDFALAFGVYLEAAEEDRGLQREIESVFKRFKKDYNPTENK